MPNTKKVKDFNEGDKLSVKLLVKSSTRAVTNTGSPYLNLVLQDNTGSLDGKLWDVKEEQVKAIEVGKILEFRIDVLSYKGNLQLKVLSIADVIQSEENIADYLPTGDLDKDTLRTKINDYLTSIENENIKMIVRAMVIKYEDRLYEYPAASKIHHSFVGGLATHTVEMLNIANSFCQLYPMLSRDLMIGGIILHDLGKTEELGGNITTDYTLKGRLLGHISICNQNLFEVGKKLKLEDSDELLLLQHMVLSHHGQLEFGSPVRPLLLEAELVYMIDNMDAKTNTVLKALSETKTGEFTQKMMSLDNRTFYKHQLFKD